MIDAEVGIKLLVDDPVCDFSYRKKDGYGPVFEVSVDLGFFWMEWISITFHDQGTVRGSNSQCEYLHTRGTGDTA